MFLPCLNKVYDDDDDDGRSLGEGGRVEQKTNLGEGPGEQPPPPSHPLPHAQTF